MAARASSPRSASPTSLISPRRSSASTAPQVPSNSATILPPSKPSFSSSSPSSTAPRLPPLVLPDYAYRGTYLFLAGCLVFSFHSVLLLYEDGVSLASTAYFLGATLFTAGSLCYAVDAEQRAQPAKGS